MGFANAFKEISLNSIMQKMIVKHYPLSVWAKRMIGIALIANLLSILVVLYYYPNLPGTVATHYNISGAANAYGSKLNLMVVPGIFIAMYILFLLIIRYRYTLLEKYPYLINLPSFVYRLGMEKNPTVQGQIINRVFTVYSVSVLFISLLNIVITTYIFMQADTGQPGVFLLPGIIVIIVLFVATVLLFYRSIYRSFAEKE